MPSKTKNTASKKKIESTRQGALAVGRSSLGRLRMLLHAVPSPSVVRVTNGEEYCTFILFSGMKKIKESQIPAKLRL